MHDDATEDLQHSGQASGPMQNVSAAPTERLQQMAVLKLAPQADGTMTSAEHRADELYLHLLYAINGMMPFMFALLTNHWCACLYALTLVASLCCRSFSEGCHQSNSWL